MIQDNILPRKIHDDVTLLDSTFVSPKKATSREIASLQAAVPLNSEEKKITSNIDKNSIVHKYKNSCLWELGISTPVASARKGEPTRVPTSYPTIAQLVRDCTMKPSLDHQYRVDDLSLQNIIIILIKDVNSYLPVKEIMCLRILNKLYNKVILDIFKLRTLDFSILPKPRLDYASQESISQARVDMATAGMIHYGLHPGMLVRYLNGEYTGESRDVPAILKKVSPHIS
jgi:hypothetical protein